MWPLRRMSLMSWKDRNANDKVLNMAKTKSSLMEKNEKKTSKIMGHCMRNNSLEI